MYISWTGNQPLTHLVVSLIFLKSTQSPAIEVSNDGAALRAINVGDDKNDGDCARTEKHLLWTKESLRLVSYFLLSNSLHVLQY